VTSSGAVFLRHAGFIDGSTTEASWLYVSDTGLDQLIRVPVLTLDGTFDVVGGDKVVKQVFIICVVVEGK